MSDKTEVLYSYKVRTDIKFFIRKILGIPLHPGQVLWLDNSRKKVNILKPGNRWGKTLITACKHIHKCMTKQGMDFDNEHDFFDAKYETLNFGPAYEQSREVLRLAVDLVEGKIAIPSEYQAEYGKYNKSLLKGWAITSDRSEAQVMPSVEFVTKAKLLARSYSDMGSAFKSKAIRYMSGDECADIAELWTFTNVTLLPRLVSTKGTLDFVGTVQAEGFDYLHMIDMARDDMLNSDWELNGMFYLQEGSMYENAFLDKEEIQRTERIADEDIRQQIIYGNYVETGDKYFGYERIRNAIDKNLKFLEYGIPGQKYVTSVDFSAGESKYSDYTVIATLDYTTYPIKLVYFWRIQGKEMPMPLQHEKVKEAIEKFPGKLVIDGQALGGKISAAYLRSLNPVAFQINGRIKGDMLSTFKMYLDGADTQYQRKTKELDDGTVIDLVEPWGLLRIPNLKVIADELRNYKLDDKKIRQDITMTLVQAIYYIDLRKPKNNTRKAVDFNLLSII